MKKKDLKEKILKHRKECKAVYNKLYKLFPHPDEIKREDILTLDESQLYAWLEEIEWQM